MSARGYCRTHYERFRVHGDPDIVLKATLAPRAGDQNPNWVGSAIKIGGAHMRVKRARGAASSHTCVHCPKLAEDWAYDHTDPDEKFATKGGYTMPYSTRIDCYIPLCKSCHKRFDLAHSKKG